MRHFVDNRFVDALFKTMLTSASIHMVILFFAALKDKDLDILNYFNILDIDYFFPDVAQGAGYFLLSGSIATLLYLVFLFTRKK